MAHYKCASAGRISRTPRRVLEVCEATAGQEPAGHTGENDKHRGGEGMY